MSAPRRSQLPALTGIRCFAALNLVFFHFSDPHSFGPLSPIVNGGYISVSFFLLLSGFILTYNYADRAQRGALTARSFWTARFSRLYPVYAFSLVLSIGMLAQEVHAHTRLDFGLGLVLTPLLLQGWHPAVTTFWNTPAWTMSTEAFFYLLFPWLITRRRPRQIRSHGGHPVCCMAFQPGASGALYALQPGWGSPSRPLFCRDMDAGAEIHAAAASPVLPIRHGLGFLNEKIRPESRKRLAIGLLAFGALYLLLCVGDHLPYVMMHDGLLMPLFAGVILCLAGQNRSRKFLRAAALHRYRRGQLLLVSAALQSLDAAARFAFSGEERPDRVRSLDLVPVADRRGALNKRLIERPGRTWISRRLQPSA